MHVYRSGEVVKLRDLLDEAEALCTHTLLQRREKAGAGVRHSDDPVEGGVDDGVDMNGSTADADADLQETARAIAYSCIKYADLR